METGLVGEDLCCCCDAEECLTLALAEPLSFLALLLLELLLLLVGVTDLCWVVGVAADLCPGVGAVVLVAVLPAGEGLAGGDAFGAFAVGDLLPLAVLAAGCCCCCLKGDPLTPFDDTRLGARSMFWFTWRGEGVFSTAASAPPPICTTEVLGDADASEVTDVFGVGGVASSSLGWWVMEEGDLATPLSNWDLMASKFLPEKVLDTTVFCTRT